MLHQLKMLLKCFYALNKRYLMRVLTFDIHNLIAGPTIGAS